MFFWRPRYREIEGVDPVAFVGGSPRRYGEVHAQTYINLSGTAPAGYPLGLFLLWRPVSVGGPDEAGIESLFDAIDPLASAVSSFWFDDGSGVAAVALAAWLVRRRGWEKSRALAATAPKAALLTKAARARWFGPAEAPATR
ncbi:MAG: hypothetical protein ACI8PZ_003078 [Myxococcota bacterium]|jgi:hypothetical protein